jgi:hypothetical protein
MKNYYTLNFYFTQNDFLKKIQTTRSNNPIGLNFLKRFTHNSLIVVTTNKQKMKTKIGFTCDLLIVTFSTQITQGQKNLINKNQGWNPSIKSTKQMRI